MSRIHEVYYLINTRLDPSMVGWSDNPFIVKTYYHLCVNKYEMKENDVQIIKLISKKELNDFIKSNSESLFDMKFEDAASCWYPMEGFVDALKLHVVSSKSIGGHNKFAITTFWFIDDVISNGYMDGLTSDAHNFVHAINYVVATLQKFLRGEVREQMEHQWSLIMNYANLHVIRESYDCTAWECNTDLQSKDFQMVRDAFLKSTGIDIIYDWDEDYLESYNGIFDQLTWMIDSGLAIDWI